MNNNTLKWIVSIIILVGIGTFIMNILENIEINVWIARIVGVIIAVIVELIFNNLWFKKRRK